MLFVPAPAVASTTIKIVSMQPTNSIEFKSLEVFIDDVEALTSGRLKFKIVLIEEKFSATEILEEVSDGQIDAVFSRTNISAKEYPETMLFGSPLLGSGVGFDKSTFLSWLHFGGGLELYDRLWSEVGLNIKSFIMQSWGPNALGWFDKPMKNFEDFQQKKIRATTEDFNDFYSELGVDTVPLRAPDITPELIKKRINGVSWCCPKEDLDLGLQKVLKYYYLQDIGTVILNSSILFNGDIYESLPVEQKKAIEIASLAAVVKNSSRDIFENGRALKELIEYHDIVLKELPEDFFGAYTYAAKSLLKKYASDSAFFSEIWQSQRDFAVIAVPYWYQKQRIKSKVGKMFLETIE